MTRIPTSDPEFTLRLATPQDAALVLDFMRKLGTYQKMRDEITATEESLHRLLAEGRGEAVFGMHRGREVGFMFFNETSSAFTGRSGLFIDGFWMEESVRHKGFGKIMMGYLASCAIERGGQMLEWGCLDWNTPTIDFYKGMGAYCLDTMWIYRLSPEDLRASAARF